MPALVALKDTNFQTRDRMRRPSNQMRIAAALVTAKRFNKFVILHNKGMLFHTSPYPATALQAYLGHKNIQHTVRYTELAPDQFKDFWRE